MNTSIDPITSEKADIFTKTILTKLQERLGTDYQLMIEKVTKNNGVVLTGLIAKKKGSSIYPTLYIDNFYKENMTELEFAKLTEELYGRICQADLNKKVDLSNFTDFEKAKSHIAYKLIHGERNKKFLEQIPHRRYHNLAIIFYYNVQEAPFCGKASIIVRNEHMKVWKIKTEELYQVALANTPILFPAMIRNMDEVMKELLESGLKEDIAHIRGEEAAVFFDEYWMEEMISQMTRNFHLNTEKIPMYVLTNRQKLYGAACILYPGVLKAFADKMKLDFYILPSSVHEVILVPALPETSAEMLRYIVADINQTQVAEDEILADSVYFYSRSRACLEWLC